LNLPTDYPRPAIQGFEGGAVYFEIPAHQTRALKELALWEEVSLYMVLLSIYNILLAKLSGLEDIVVGVGTAGRSHADLMNIIGLMFNTIPLRSRPQGGKYYPEFLRDLKTGALEAFENQEYPFDMLVQDLLTAGVLNRDTGRNPLFDTMFALQDFGEEPGRDTGTETTGLILKPYEFENRISRFDLFFIVTGTGDTLRVKVEYAAALFKPAAVERMVQGYKEILAQILTNRQIKLEDIVVSSSRRLVKVELPVDDSADSEHMGFGF
jgi:non-ribosomal peptide synthetase component F